MRRLGKSSIELLHRIQVDKGKGLRAVRCPQDNWILVKGFDLGYHNKETIVFTIAPYYGNFI